MKHTLFLLAALPMLLLAPTASAHEAATGAPALQYTKPLEAKGRVVLVEATRPGDGHLSLLALMTDGGNQWVLRGPRSEDLQAGQRASIEGLRAPGSERFSASGQVWVEDATILRQAPPAAPVTGDRGAIVAFVSWPGSGDSSYNENEAGLAGLTSWSESVSDGQFRWNPVTRVDVQLPSALAACNPDEWYLADSQWTLTVSNALQNMGYSAGDYRALGIALPQGFEADCVPTAYAYMDPSCQWGVQYYCNLSVYSYSYSDYPIFVHELGHTLNLPHANQAPCTEDGNAVSLTWSGTCSHIEYGDRYDPMGTSFSNAMYNPIFTDGLGWIPSGEILRVGSEAGITNTILSSYGGLQGTRAVQITMPGVAALEGASPGKLYLEYRGNSGFDAILYSANPAFPYVPCLATTPSHNVFLRYIPSEAAATKLNLTPEGAGGALGSSYLLDMTPGTATVCDAGLQPGASWTDPGKKLRISFPERASDLSSATLQIEKFADPQPPSPPALTLQRISPSPSNTAPVWRLLGDKDLQEASITPGDFQVTGGKVSSINGSGPSYQITVLPDRDGAVQLVPSASFALSSVDGAVATEVALGESEAAFDATPPAVVQFARQGQSPSREDVATWALLFSEPVQGVSPSNFLTDCSLASLEKASDASYTVSLQGCAEGRTAPRAQLGNVRDAAGNALQAADVFGDEVLFDRSEAAPVLRGKPPRRTNSRRAKFSWQGEASFFCAIDRKAFKPCRSGVSYKLAPGKHRFLLRAEDALGNRSSVTSYRWKIN